MESIGQDQHPDFLAEGGQRLGQSLAVLATLGEAAARLAAVELRRRQWREDQNTRRRERYGEHAADPETGRPSPTSPDDAARRAARHDRRIIAQALDEVWLGRADLYDLAVVWRAARLREPQFQEARGAADQVEDRLREFYPGPMRGYDDAVFAGTPRHQAMADAVRQMARTPVMRAHPGRRSAAVQAGTGATVGDDDLDGAIRAELARLAAGLPEGTAIGDLRRLGVAGRAAAEHLQRMLDAHAASRPVAQAATPPPTEPRLPTPPQTAYAWYPGGVGAVPGHVAGLQPANAPLPFLGQQPRRTR